jgi:hypothetical protein
MLRRQLPLILFVALYMVGFTAFALSRGNTEFVFYAIVMLVLIAGVFAIHRRVQFSPLALWLLATWGLLHMAGGNIPVPTSLAVDWTPAPGKPPDTTVLYNLRPFPWFPKYDQIIHAFGFFCATIASFEALRAAWIGRPSRAPALINERPFKITLGFTFAAFLTGMGLGALNEVVEFTATRFMDTNVGDYVNTGWDLVSNMTGAATAAALILLKANPRS